MQSQDLFSVLIFRFLPFGRKLERRETLTQHGLTIEIWFLWEVNALVSAKAFFHKCNAYYKASFLLYIATKKLLLLTFLYPMVSSVIFLNVIGITIAHSPTLNGLYAFWKGMVWMIIHFCNSTSRGFSFHFYHFSYRLYFDKWVLCPEGYREMDNNLSTYWISVYLTLFNLEDKRKKILIWRFNSLNGLCWNGDHRIQRVEVKH